MAYHTAVYLFLFLPLVLLAYQLTPRKARRVVLLLSGYAFFWLVSGRLVIFLIGTTLFTWFAGVWMSWLKSKCCAKAEGVSREEGAKLRKQYKKKEKQILTGAVALLLLVLGYLKYYNFFAKNVNGVLRAFGTGEILKAKTLLLPIGISFYTLQAIGYLADVYWEKIPAERQLGKLALFLGFFPQIMEGPISMYSQTADSLWEGKSLQGENLSAGIRRILWGLFKKMIVADRLYILVHAVFDHYEKYSGIVVAAAAVAYTVQLYMEFSGCMDIVIGSGRMFGVTLPENFRQPFFSGNAAEFWRRWHITLGAWFKAYIFYPVSVSSLVKKWNRFGRKHFGKQTVKVGISAIALLPVWVCNGLWHGSRWSYIFYGMYYFVIILAGIVLEPVHNRIVKAFSIREEALYWKIPKILKTWVIIFVGELFFRANGLRAGLHMFFSIFRNFAVEKLWDGTLLSFGLDGADYLAIAAGCAVVAAVGLYREKNPHAEADFQKLRTPLRWGVYYSLILAVVILGAYGTGYQQVDLIYAGF